jgi:hypothetical protein
VYTTLIHMVVSLLLKWDTSFVTSAGCCTSARDLARVTAMALSESCRCQVLVWLWLGSRLSCGAAGTDEYCRFCLDNLRNYDVSAINRPSC